jgi:hypothetical protein
VNVGVIARRPEFYEFLRERADGRARAAALRRLVKGGVERFELPNLHALNFLLHEALGGGGTVSLMTDAQGKTFSTAMLRMEIDLPDELAALLDAPADDAKRPDEVAPDDGRVLHSDRDGAVATITLNRPDKRNALDTRTVDGMRIAIAELDATTTSASSC